MSLWPVRYPIFLLSLLVAGNAHGADSGTAVSLFDGVRAHPVWHHLAVAPGPGSDGAPALRWEVAARPAVDSPAFPRDWRSFDELRFLAHLDQPRDFALSLVFIADHGYFHIRLPLDWTGWKEHRIRLADCRKSSPEARWEEVHRFGFRAQGYGQGPVPDRLSIAFRNIALHAPAVLPFQSLDEWTVFERRSELLSLKKQGNPYHAAVFAALDRAPPVPAADAQVTSAWAFSGHAGRALAAAWAASWEQSPRRGDPALVERACALVDFCLARQREGSWFYARKWESGDPNSDRFALGPLMDAVYWLRSLPAGQQHWPRWETPLRQLVDFQLTRWAHHRKLGFEKNEAWGQAALTYPNQDVFHLVEMALAHRFWNDARYLESAEETLASLERNLLPDGGFHYIGPETECDVYHGVNLVWIARYYLLTNDLRAKSLLARTVPYYPLSSSNEAWPEYYTDCWWKHYWSDGRACGPEIVAGIAGDGQNRWLAERLLERVGPGDAQDAITAGMFYRSDLIPAPLPDHWLRMDRNISGPRARFGNWYFAATPGGGARDTFVGAMISRPDRLLPLQGALLAANLEVGLSTEAPRQRHCLYLSGPDDIAATAIEGEAAAIAARYSPRKPYINSVRNPEVAPTPWRGTQLWILTRHGLLGWLELEATDRQEAAFLGGELRLGPGFPLERLGEGRYRCGELGVRLLEHNFSEVAHGPARPGYAEKETRHQAITLRTPGSRFVAEPNRPLHFAAVIAPEATGGCDGSVKDVSWTEAGPLWILRAEIAGRRYALAFNPSDQPATAIDPFDAKTKDPIPAGAVRLLANQP